MSLRSGLLLLELLALVVVWPHQAAARSGDAEVGFEAVDDAIEQAIAAEQTPGAVLLVGRGDRIVHRKAYGQRAIVPRAEKMTLDTIFDLASLTKVIGTAPSVLILVDEGKLRLDDTVAQWIPEFGRDGKEQITIRQLLTHTSGLRGDVDLAEPWLGYDKAIELATAEKLEAAPGENFIYSDIGFFLLAEVVARASKRPFDRFVAERILKRLQMRDSMFNPPASLARRIAPTQICTRYGWPCDGPDQIMLRGIVHDPTARRMNGVAGHAGLFGTAADVARFAEMILNGGAAPRGRVLEMAAVRGLGWDIDTNYSAPRGEVFPIGSFGHTGWTGTSLWIDPASRVYVVLLTNRVHPDGSGDVRELRSRVSTLVAKALLRP
jgi:CubicO group peptidase (beta-lactamase class C family)